MWKYIVTWGLYIMGTVNEGVNIGQPGYQRVGSDTALFFNSDSARIFIEDTRINYTVAPHNRLGKVFNLKIDSVYIKRESFFHRLFKN